MFIIRWFQVFVIFTLILGESIQFDEYFSDELKPPTRIYPHIIVGNETFYSYFIELILVMITNYGSSSDHHFDVRLLGYDAFGTWIFFYMFLHDGHFK